MPIELLRQSLDPIFVERKFCRSGELEGFEDGNRRSPQKPEDPARWVGLFEVRESELLAGGIVRMITAEDFVDHAGLVYSPKQKPPVRGEDRYSRLYGSWWHWQRSW